MRLYSHVLGDDRKVSRHWFEAERSSHAVGGQQNESKEEKLAAAARGKATASVIGTRAMGTRFNVLATVQVPLKQKKRMSRSSAWGEGVYYAAEMGMAMDESPDMDEDFEEME